MGITVLLTVYPNLSKEQHNLLKNKKVRAF